MKASNLGLFFCSIGLLSSFAQTSQATSPTTKTTKAEQEIIDLSKQKWQWMADKNVDKQAVLFHDESKFVHMSGTWKKDEELEIIKTDSIWYKQADVHVAAVEQSNFHNYRLIRHNEAPKSIDVHFVENDLAPTGLGEPPFPPVFGAVANALYKNKGKRFYNQPIQNEMDK